MKRAFGVWKEQQRDARLEGREVRLQQSPVASQRHGFVTILRIQLLIDAARLGPDGVDRDHQLGSDLCIGETSRKQAKNFALAVSERLARRLPMRRRWRERTLCWVFCLQHREQCV